VAVLVVLALAAVALRPLLRNRQPTYPGRGTREDLLATVHQAIRAQDYATFATCFDADLLDARLEPPRAETFRKRARTVSDFRWKLEKPRSRAPESVSLRGLSGKALPTILGIDAKGPVGLVIPPSEGDYLIAEVVDTPFARAPLPPDELRRVKEQVHAKVQGFFDHLGENLLPLISKRPGMRNLSAEEKRKLVERIRPLLGATRAEYTIVEEDSMYSRDYARVIVKCPRLARAIGTRRETFPIDVRRDPRNDTWKLIPRRKPER
jgi:hypothetical protein